MPVTRLLCLTCWLCPACWWPGWRWWSGGTLSLLGLGLSLLGLGYLYQRYVFTPKQAASEMA
ncbi:MAG: hypothetical protein ACLFVN_07335 [Phycisphaeraceae bacterium]